LAPPSQVQQQQRSGRVPIGGWSEPAPTNAPVADEPVEAVFRMNENPILPARIFFFFSPLLYPKIFPPPTYHLPPPSYLPPTNPSPPSLHRQSSRDVERERAWSRGAWSRGAARAGVGPMRDPSKHLTFFSFVYFVCLFMELRCIRYVTL
jgi:hypothetical protein